MTCVCCAADDSEEENLDLDLGQVGNHAFARMEADVDKQRKQILQGQMSEAAAQKQHQRKYVPPPRSSAGPVAVATTAPASMLFFSCDPAATVAGCVAPEQKTCPTSPRSKPCTKPVSVCVCGSFSGCVSSVGR